MQDITIYTTAICPYCEQAKRLFKTLKLPYKEVPLDGNPDLRAKLSAEQKGWRTVPMIFVGQEFLGGFSDVKELHDKGEFLPKVQLNS